MAPDQEFLSRPAARPPSSSPDDDDPSPVAATSNSGGSSQEHSTSRSGIAGSETSHPAKKDCKKDLAEALASLQLPRMPSLHHQVDADGVPTTTSIEQMPTVTILVVADIDLASTTALAEYLLMQQQLTRQRPQHQRSTTATAAMIDLIIAAGPCTRDEDLLTYCQGSAQRAKYKRRQQQQQQHVATTHPPPSYYATTTDSTQNRSSNSTIIMTRSRETSSALEGLMTAALSQLESIVCRVVYCPGFSDPLTVILDNKRLTPNSRNLHRQWLPLVPGLGCAGLFYLDGTEHIMAQYYSSATAAAYHDEDDDASSDSDDVGENTVMVLAEQIKKMQQSPSGYIPTLSKLLDLAPEPPSVADPQTPKNPLQLGKGQSILVTHYVDGRKLFRQDEDDNSAFRADGEDSDNDDSAGGGGGDLDDENAVTLKCSCSGAVPWPADHKEFLQDDHTSRLLALEIASGSAVNHPAAWIRGSSGKQPTTTTTGPHGGNRATSVIGKNNSSSKAPVLLPGSLRERGEFSILSLALVEQDDPTERRQFAWEVQSVDFHRLDNFGNN